MAKSPRSAKCRPPMSTRSRRRWATESAPDAVFARHPHPTLPRSRGRAFLCASFLFLPRLRGRVGEGVPHDRSIPMKTPDHIELAPGLRISRVVTGLWQVADMERGGKFLDLDRAAAALGEYAAAGFDTFDMADH